MYTATMANAWCYYNNNSLLWQLYNWIVHSNLWIAKHNRNQYKGVYGIDDKCGCIVQMHTWSVKFLFEPGLYIINVETTMFIKNVYNQAVMLFAIFSFIN